MSDLAIYTTVYRTEDRGVPVYKSYTEWNHRYATNATKYFCPYQFNKFPSNIITIDTYFSSFSMRPALCGLLLFSRQRSLDSCLTGAYGEEERTIVCIPGGGGGRGSRGRRPSCRRPEVCLGPGDGWCVGVGDPGTGWGLAACQPSHHGKSLLHGGRWWMGCSTRLKLSPPVHCSQAFYRYKESELNKMNRWWERCHARKPDHIKGALSS